MYKGIKEDNIAQNCPFFPVVNQQDNESRPRKTLERKTANDNLRKVNSNS
jgi:hypothetical protein